MTDYKPLAVEYDYAEIVRELRQDASTSRNLYLANAIEELSLAAEVNAKRALKWAFDAEKEKEKFRWIPVTERLPEHEYGESTSVLTVDLYGVIRVTYFDGGNWCWPTGEALTTMRVAPITHWMPLPAPPKGETDGCGRCDSCRINETGTCRYGEGTE